MDKAMEVIKQQGRDNNNPHGGANILNSLNKAEDEDEDSDDDNEDDEEEEVSEYDEKFKK